MIIQNEFQEVDIGASYADRIFRLYHPLTCEYKNLNLPQPYPNKIFEVIERSRRILINRNFDEIYFAVNQLNEMNSIMLYGLPEDDSETRYPHDYIVPLFDYMSSFDIAQLDEFPDATWPEFFAVSALTCIGIIFESFDRNDETYEQSIGLEDATDWEFFAFETALYAAEAIAYAESLAHISTDIDTEVKKKISIKNRIAVNIRHAPKNAIKKEYAEFYQNNTHPSKAEAARRFYRHLSDDKKKHFRNEDSAERSLNEFLRKLKKVRP